MSKLFKVTLEPTKDFSHIGQFTVDGQLLHFNNTGEIPRGEFRHINVYETDEPKANCIATTNKTVHQRSSKIVQLLSMAFMLEYIRTWNEGKPIKEVELGEPTSTGIATVYTAYLENGKALVNIENMVKLETKLNPIFNKSLYGQEDFPESAKAVFGKEKHYAVDYVIKDNEEKQKLIEQLEQTNLELVSKIEDLESFIRCFRNAILTFTRSTIV